MPTDTDFVNDALGMIGQDAIASLNPSLTNKIIPIAKNALVRVKRATLRARDWNCARRRKALDPVDNTSLGEWGNAYRLPPDCLAVRRFVGPWERHQRHAYSVEIDDQKKRIIFCNIGPNASIVYTADLQDVALWDALLYDAGVKRLASELAAVWGKDVKLSQNLLQHYAMSFDETVGVDEAEGGLERNISTGFLDVRAGGAAFRGPTNVIR